MRTAYPKVSVFLPTYNQKHYVQEAIESVLMQHYPNFEIVIGDDGSIDGTQEILLQYKEKNPELYKLILSEKNEGITANCNKILQECTGEYVAMFAGDDVWLAGKIHKQVECMEKNRDAVLCYSKVETFNSQDGTTLAIKHPEDFDHTSQDDIVEFSYTLAGVGPSMLIRSSAIPEHGFESRVPAVSDWLFWLEVLTKGRAIFVNEVLARYRRHSQNTSTNFELIFAEHLVTLYLIEQKYPSLVAYVEKKRMDRIMSQFAYYLGSKDDSYKKILLTRIFRMSDMKQIINVLAKDVVFRINRRLKRN